MNVLLELKTQADNTKYTAITTAIQRILLVAENKEPGQQPEKVKIALDKCGGFFECAFRHITDKVIVHTNPEQPSPIPFFKTAKELRPHQDLETSVSHYTCLMLLLKNAIMEMFAKKSDVVIFSDKEEICIFLKHLQTNVSNAIDRGQTGCFG